MSGFLSEKRLAIIEKHRDSGCIHYCGGGSNKADSQSPAHGSLTVGMLVDGRTIISVQFPPYSDGWTSRRAFEFRTLHDLQSYDLADLVQDAIDIEFDENNQKMWAVGDDIEQFKYQAVAAIRDLLGRDYAGDRPLGYSTPI